jgi:ribosome-associated protein
MPGVEHPLAGGKPAITLAQFLKVMDVAQTGGHAKALVRSGVVRVNGQPDDRPGRKLAIGDRVEVEGQTLVVDR